ncbi:MAG: 2Fe-2S iron-sulfur cluster-binding protein [Actinomycetota bacterium]
MSSEAKEISFTFNGEVISANSNQSVAAAILASGIRGATENSEP